MGFVPEIGRTDSNNEEESACANVSNIPIQCTGEVCWKNISNLIFQLIDSIQYPFDRDMLGNVMYYSESGSSDICGSIDIKHFPYP